MAMQISSAILLLPLGLVEYVSDGARAKQKTTRYAGGQSKF